MTIEHLGDFGEMILKYNGMEKLSMNKKKRRMSIQ